MTSYQRLKAENEKLKQDIYALIKKEKEPIGIETKLKWEFIFRTSEMIFRGSPTAKKSKFDGIL